MTFTMVGRTEIDGYPTIALDVAPRRGVDAHTDIRKIVRKASGRAWFSEEDYQLVRCDLNAVDTISYGWGVLIRVQPGTKLRFEQQRLSDGSWVPAVFHVTGDIRILLIGTKSVNTRVEYRRLPEVPHLPDSIPEAAAATAAGEFSSETCCR